MAEKQRKKHIKNNFKKKSKSLAKQQPDNVSKSEATDNTKCESATNKDMLQSEIKKNNFLKIVLLNEIKSCYSKVCMYTKLWMKM